MTPSPDPVCPQCGSPLPDHAPQGLCPKCLYAALAQLTGEEPDPVRLPPPDPTSAPVPPAAVPPPVPWRDPGPLPGTPAVPSRMSRMAVIGACWAPCFLLLGLGFFRLGNVHVQSTEPVPPAWWQISLRLILLPLGFIAPFGTTNPGWMAVSRIRHSSGRIHGLRLAVADGLFFPMLFLPGLAGWFWNWLLHDVVRGAHIDSSRPRSAIGQMLVNHAGGFAVPATGLTMAVSGTLLHAPCQGSLKSGERNLRQSLRPPLLLPPAVVAAACSPSPARCFCLPCS